MTARRAGPPPVSMMAMAAHPTVTALESSTLRQLEFGKDPWCGKGGGVGSRKYSGAIGRLQEKGLITKEPYAQWGFELTPAGRAYLASTATTKETKR